MRSLNSARRRIRELEEERDFLRDCLFVQSGGTFEEIKIEMVRQEESVAPDPVDDTVRTILQDMLN